MFLKKEQASLFFEILFFLLQPKDPLQSLEDYIEANSDIHFYLWVPFVLSNVKMNASEIKLLMMPILFFLTLRKMSPELAH